MNAKRLAIVVVWALVSVALPVSTLALSVGVAPTEIALEDALRGNSYDAVIFVLNPDPEAARCELSLTGEAAEWITLYTDEERTQEAGILSLSPEENLPVYLRVMVPDSVPNRGYSAQVDVAMGAAPASIEAGNAAVILHANATININVTGTQRLEGSVQGLLIRDTEIGYPGRAILDITNEGNIEVTPRLDIALFAASVPAGEYSVLGEAVPPGEMVAVPFELPFEELAPADYTAITNIYIADLKLETLTNELSILPRGSLTQDGTIRTLVGEGELYTDRMLMLHTEFMNTGQIESNAQLFAEIYRDDVLIGIEKSLELLVLPGETKDLTAYVALDEPGQYRAICKVVYGIKETESLIWEGAVIPAVVAESEAAVDVVPTVSETAGDYTYLALLAAAVVGVGVLIVLGRRRAQKRST